jgi:hypothetical protein
MSNRIIINILVFILAAGAVFCYFLISDLYDRISSLQLNYLELQNENNIIKANYDSLEKVYRSNLDNYNNLLDDYSDLNSEYQIIQTNIQSLQNNYDSLKSNYDSLHTQHDKLKSDLTSLTSKYDSLEADNQDLQELLDQYEKVPHSYYSMDTFKKYSNTWNDLSRFLKSEFKLPTDYEEDLFDCSESSAYLEWSLENSGFDAYIVVGPDPSGESGYHAWVLVYTTDYKVAIESTALTSSQRAAWLSWGRVPGVIYGDDQLIKHWENYYENYDESFKNIYFAIRDCHRNSEEWDWWLGAFGFK